jgi:NAD(P)-dependent dehydrogenase (short-subunit alcohol dehydrogenase family)
MLEGKSVLVSGGTGYLGSGICRTFHASGSRVTFTYNRQKEKADALCEELPGSTALELDLRNVNDVEEKIKAQVEHSGPFDILVNNASVSHILPLSMIEEEDADTVFDVNVKGTLFLTKAVVRGMIRQKKGVIVNIGSIAGHRMLDVPVTYAMSKAAIAGFTIALASELKRFNIRVNNVVPGMMEGGVSKGVPEDLQQLFLSHCAVGRAGKSDDVAGMVCFLASEKASYINGQSIFVDGGF